jgi:hypothetical protein
MAGRAYCHVLTLRQCCAGKLKAMASGANSWREFSQVGSPTGA